MQFCDCEFLFERDAPAADICRQLRRQHCKIRFTGYALHRFESEPPDHSQLLRSSISLTIPHCREVWENIVSLTNTARLLIPTQVNRLMMLVN
jgi:hypothetical protein